MPAEHALEADDATTARDASFEDVPGEGDGAPEIDGKLDKGPARIDMASPDVEAGAVRFTHASHQKMFACKKCHHTVTPGAQPGACDACHGEDGQASSMKDAMHEECKGCHAGMGAGPTSCKQCHKK